MSVYLIGTLDTKGHELAFVRAQLESYGIAALVIDAGCLGTPAVAADITREEVFSAAGVSLAEMQALGDRGKAVTLAAEGVSQLIRGFHAAGRVSGVLGIGGSAGTAIATSAMRSLAIGIPKLIVSTVASGQVRPYVGDKDILEQHLAAAD